MLPYQAAAEDHPAEEALTPEAEGAVIPEAEEDTVFSPAGKGYVIQISRL